MANYVSPGVWWLEAIFFGGAIIIWAVIGLAWPGPSPATVGQAIGLGGLGGALLGVGLWGGKRAGWKVPRRGPGS
jgi:hypothetical protein